MVFKDYGRRPSVKWTEGYVFFGFYCVVYDHLVLSHGDHIDDD
jgi:hypothetical protein